MKANVIQTVSADTLSEINKARLVALLLGAVVLFTVGFAHATPIHNAAHDTRHTLAFPCH